MIMKKTILLSLLLAFSAVTFAQTEDKKMAIGVGAGAYSPSDQGGIGLIPELYFSTFLSPKFDLMIRGNMGVLNTEQDGGIDMAGGFANLRFKFGNETKKFRPYIYAGPGYLADNTVDGFTFDAGIGAKRYFKPATAWYIDLG